MTQNGRGATKWGKAKNGTASNRDKLPLDRLQYLIAFGQWPV